MLATLESYYLLGLIPLELYTNGLHYLIGLDKTLPFLPLLLTSVYCAVGVTYAWLRFYVDVLGETKVRSHVEKID